MKFSMDSALEGLTMKILRMASWLVMCDPLIERRLRLLCDQLANNVCDRPTRTSVISSRIIWLEMGSEKYSL